MVVINVFTDVVFSTNMNHNFDSPHGAERNQILTSPLGRKMSKQKGIFNDKTDQIQEPPLLRVIQSI